MKAAAEWTGWAMKIRRASVAGVGTIPASATPSIGATSMALRLVMGIFVLKTYAMLLQR